MSDWLEMNKDPRHAAREKQKARELRKTQWWKARIADGVCHYCGKSFPPDELTMDHVVPISRGGKSTKGNVVPCCKDCNTDKQYLTPVEMLLKKLEAEKQEEEGEDVDAEE